MAAPGRRQTEVVLSSLPQSHPAHSLISVATWPLRESQYGNLDNVQAPLSKQVGRLRHAQLGLSGQALPIPASEPFHPPLLNSSGAKRAQGG